MANQRLANCFESNQKQLSLYMMAGLPSVEEQVEIMHGMVEAGVGFFEIGMPFVDPAADGPIIQAAATQALEQGVNLPKTLELIKQFRMKDSTTPVVLMGYLNPVIQYGVDAFFKTANEVGVDGVLLADMPQEEDAIIGDAANKNDVALIRLITPTSNDERIKLIADKAQGFIYYVSMAGITGDKDIDAGQALKLRVDHIRQFTPLPIAIGFGIKKPEHVKAVAPSADAVVVGSAVVDRILQLQTANDRDALLSFVRELKAAL